MYTKYTKYSIFEYNRFFEDNVNDVRKVNSERSNVIRDKNAHQGYFIFGQPKL